MATKQEKAEDRIIDRLFRTYCNGRQIGIMRIPELFKVARVALRAGETEDEIAARMVAFTDRAA